MTAIQRTLAKARRRLVMQRGLRLAGWGVLVLAGLAAAGLVAAQALGVVVPGVWYGWAAGGTLAAALVLSSLAAWLGRPDDDAVAVRVDEQLELKNSLGTGRFAASLEADGRGGRVAQHVHDDAQAVAGGVTNVSLRKAFPVAPTRVWGWALGVVAVLAVLTFDPLGLVERATNRNADAAVATATAEAARDALEDAQQAAEQLAETDAQEPETPAGGDPPEALDPETLSDRLTAMLSQRDLTNPEDRRAAAAEVSDLHDLAAQQAERREKQVQALENLMSGVDAGEPGPASDFAESMRRSDFEQARQELTKMGDALESGAVSEAQQQRMAEQLSAMADQLQQRADQQQQQADAAKQAAAQAMRDAGLSEEQVEQLAEKAQDPEAIKQELAKTNPPQSPQEEEAQEQQAEQLAQQNRDAAEQDQHGDKAGERAQQMAQQLKRMSEALDDDSPDPSQDTEPQETQSAEAGEQAGEEGTEAGAQEQSADGTSPTDEPGEQGGASEQVAGEQPGQQPGEQPGQQPGQEAGEDGSQQAGGQEPGAQDAAQPSDAQQAESSSPSGEQPGQEQGAESAQAPMTEQQKQQQMSDAMQQMQEQLGQSEQQQQGAEGAQSAAESLQQAMQQMAGQPGEQPGSQPGSQPGNQPGAGGQGNQPGPPTGAGGGQAGAQPGPGQGSGSGGNPLGPERPALGAGSHVSKDIQEGRGGRVLSSWTEGGEMTAGEAKLEFDAAVSAARAEAERAVSDDRTPQRYHKAIRDYFGNLPEEAPPAAEGAVGPRGQGAE